MYTKYYFVLLIKVTKTAVGKKKDAFIVHCEPEGGL